MKIKERTKEIEDKIKKEYKKLGKEEEGTSIEEMERAVSDYYQNKGTLMEDFYDFIQRNC
ncbi:hypothetical protein BH721_01915 [Clostridium baratii]|uniref:Uncharacterized protein n=1 Tax=Clostridium baratii TaxID=1561 RepID=A0A174R3D0_9CLOT|nr:hypothetical protein [Clostridium baratii]OPF51440.1 hypothetical protein A1M12_02560 [Clostridium baratii]OPF54487.1 hypothetical protein BH724_14580 [Clostridium baratii]OPF55488.1 hypothetical protein BH721_01915 [Clostridium baratii]OPF60131.1 hypothetical protein BH725_06010 [Clostridium baratii]CUP78681.1 Uncharacterised protein [Clostridium baratii]